MHLREHESFLRFADSSEAYFVTIQVYTLRKQPQHQLSHFHLEREKNPTVVLYPRIHPGIGHKHCFALAGVGGNQGHFTERKSTYHNIEVFDSSWHTPTPLGARQVILEFWNKFGNRVINPLDFFCRLR